MTTDKKDWRPYLFVNGHQQLAIIAPSARAAQELFRCRRFVGAYVGEDRRIPQQREESRTLALTYEVPQ